MAVAQGLMLRLLGRPQVIGAHAAKPFPEKGFHLIALAALSQGMSITRRDAAAVLWDHTDEAGALNNLRQLLARMRQHDFGFAQWITVDARDVTVAGRGERIDVCRFIDEGPEPLLDLYPGPLLDQATDMSQAFESWLRIERSRLQEVFFQRCARALRDMTHLGRSSVADIAAYESHLLRLEPEREDSFKIVIEAYGRCGHFVEAARLSRQLMAVAKSEHASVLVRETETSVRRVLSAVDTSVFPSTELPRGKRQPARVAFLQPKWGNITAEATELLKFLIEDVSNELARYRTFVMLAPHSSFQVEHDSGLPLDNAALKADYTVSGFMKPGGTLSLRMAHCGSQEIIWTGEFPAQPQQVLACFNQLTRRIAANLASGVERHFQDDMRRTSDRNAYQAYLAGQHAMQDCKLASLRRARKYFKESADHDPQFAPAYARVAQTLYQEWLMTGADDATLLSGARSHADQAVGLDGNSGLARWMTGVVSLYQRDFDVCERTFEEAEVLAPNSSDLLIQYGDALAFLGRPDEGIAKFNKALDINPMPPEHYWWAGASIAFYQGDYESAITHCRRISNDESVVRILAAAHGMNGDHDQAQHYGRKFRELFPTLNIEHMMRLPPDRSGDGVKRFVEGLRLAGVK